MCARTFGHFNTSLVSQRRKAQFFQNFTSCVNHFFIRPWLMVFVPALPPFLEKFIGFVFGESRSGSCNGIRAYDFTLTLHICDERQRHVNIYLILLPDSSSKRVHDTDALSNV
jgi:hypothetical protein